MPGEYPMQPFIGMEDPWRYRNKAQFPIGKSRDGQTVTGFYAGRTHAIVENRNCLAWIQEVNEQVLDLVHGVDEKIHGVAAL